MWLRFGLGPKKNHPVCFSHIHLDQTLDSFNFATVQSTPFYSIEDFKFDPRPRSSQAVHRQHCRGADTQLHSNHCPHTQTPHFLFPPLARHEPPPEEQDRRERKFSLLTLHYSSGTHKALQDKSQWHPLTSSPPLPQSLTPEEQRLFRLYGKLPSRSDHFAKHLKERKYFDSGDYAMSKAGKGDGVDTGTVGSQHPVPENIPHNSGGSSSNGVGGPATATPPGLTKSGSISGASGGLPGGLAGSPAKESSSGLVRETSAEEDPDNKENAGDAAQQGIPIRS